LTNTGKIGEANGRSLAAIIAELKNDLAQFLQTRYQMLVAEMKGKFNTWKTAVLWLLVAAFLASIAVLLLTGALVVLISVAVGVGWSLLIVGVAYLLFAGISVVIVRGELKSTPVTPERTLHVLQEDKIWLQQEAKSV
jgi:uncharacterized membrane protein